MKGHSYCTIVQFFHETPVLVPLAKILISTAFAALWRLCGSFAIASDLFPVGRLQFGREVLYLSMMKNISFMKSN